jgi:hypothetical protein
MFVLRLEGIIVVKNIDAFSNLLLCTLFETSSTWMVLNSWAPSRCWLMVPSHVSSLFLIMLMLRTFRDL